MLDALRRFVKSWVAKILLGLLIVSFAVWGIEGVFNGSTNPTIARVGTAPIDAQKFVNAITRQQNQISRQRRAVISLQELRDAGIDESTLQALVRDATFASELEALELAIPAEAVAENIRTNAAFQDGQGQFSQFTYQTRLSQEGFDPIEFEQLTRALLGQQILINATGHAGHYAPDVAVEMAKWRGERRAVRMITLPIDTAPEPAAPTDAQLQTYFDANSDAFVEPDRRWGRVLHTELSGLAEELAPTDEGIRAQYDANQDNYTQVATRTLEQISFPDMTAAQAAADRLAAGEVTFAEVAVEQNTDAASLSLGTVQQADLPEATGKAAFEATENGIVGPVEGPFNVVLLNVTDVQLGGLAPFEEVSDLISTQLLQGRLQAKIPELANQIDDIRSSGASLAEIAEQTGLPLVEFAGIAQNFTVAEGDFPTAAYDQRLMADLFDSSEGEERDLVELSDGTYALIMIDRIVDSHLPELATIRDKVADAWITEQKLASLEARALDLTSEIAGGSDLATKATEMSLEVTSPEAFPRQEAPASLSADLVEAVFSGTLNSYVSGRNQGADGVVILQITVIQPLEADALAEEKEGLEQALEDSLARDHLEYFARALSETHNASINRDAIDTLFERLGQASGHGGNY